MGLKYIFGGAGTGKTTEALNQMLENQNDNRTIVYIVPEQFSLQSEKYILNLTNMNTTMSVKVVSFKRLAYHVFSETGLKKVKVLDDISKIMLIRKILFKLKNDLKFFERTKITEGFASKLSSTITELYQYNINPNELNLALKDIAGRQGLSLKVEDIALIYREYVSYIGENYISIDESLDILAQNVKESNLLENSSIWIDEFNGFTHQEYKVIRELMKKSSDVTVALTIKSKSISYDNISETDIFYETKRTVNKLTKLAVESSKKVYKPLYLSENKRHKHNSQLKHLEQNMFESNPVSYKGESTSLKIQPLLNMYEEAAYISEEIITLIRDKGYSYSDIAILTSNSKIYQKSIKSVLMKYDIPFFIDANQDMLSHPLLETIRAMLDVVIKNWSYESVFRLLKTDMLNINMGDIDILENYVLANGIKSYKWKTDVWEYGFNSNYENFDKEKINDIKNNVVSIIEVFEKNLTYKTQLTIKEISTRIFKMLYSINIAKTMQRLLNEAIEEKNTELMLQHSQIWKKVCELFEKMVDVLGEEKVSISEFSAIFESGILSTNMGSIPPTQDRVIVGDMSRSRLPNIKALFIIGANEGIFPCARADDGIFNNEERLLIDSLGIELAPSSRRKVFEENFLIYTFLLKPKDLLVLTYSQGSLDGKSMLPAYIVSCVRKLFKDIDFDSKKDFQISTPSVMRAKLSVALKDYYQKEQISDTVLSVYKWFKENESDSIKIIENIVLSSNKVQKLTKDSAEKLYGKVVTTSVSRLENYVRCPFSFFINYNLKVKERKIYQISNLDIGEVFHSILESFTNMIVEENLDIKTLTKDEINNYVDSCINSTISNLEKDVFFSNMRYKYILERVARISKKSIWALCQHIKAGTFSLYGSEVEFSSKSPLTGIVVEIDESRKFVFTGRIDRIDVMSANGNKYVKIIDYKSSAKKFDATDIYYGMQLQLMLYLDSILKSGEKYFNIDRTKGKLMPGGVFYFKIDDPMISISNKLDKDDLKERFLKNFKMSGLVLEDDEVIKAMDENMKQNSLIIPVSKNKDGAYSSRSDSLANEETFENIMKFTTKKVKEIGASLMDGEISPFPYKKGNANACMYCNYESICSFEPKNGVDYMYNVFQGKKRISDLK